MYIHIDTKKTYTHIFLSISEMVGRSHPQQGVGCRGVYHVGVCTFIVVDLVSSLERCGDDPK